MKFIDEYRDGEAAQRYAPNDPSFGEARMDHHGGVWRADPLDCQIRHR